MSKIFVIAPNSIHTVNFLQYVKGLFDEVVLCCNERLEHKAASKFYKLDFRSVNPIKIKKSQKALKQILTNERPDVVHLHQITRHAFFSVPVIHRMKFKIVCSAWGSDVLVMPDKNLLFRRAVQSVLRKSDVVIGDSKDMVTKISELGAPNKTALIMFGIDPIEADEKRKVIFSNRLHAKLYNIDLVIKLFAEFEQKHQEWVLRIAGSGEETKGLKELVERLHLTGSVEFIGWLDGAENRRQYSKATIYVSIPDSDGTSVSVLEAMSAGCIPVLAALDVSKEWVSDGVNGVLYDGKNNPFFKALELDRQQVQQINQGIIRERATVEVTVDKYRAIYQSLNVI